MWANKILKNDIDEGFAKVHEKLKGSMVELFIAAMEKRYKNKPKTYIRYLIEKALRGSISKSMALDLVSTIFSYDEHQKNILVRRIEECPPAKLSATKE